MLATVALGLAAPFQTSRFELAAPLSLPAVYVQEALAKHGIGQSTARRMGLQARILWVDATANIGRYNSTQKIADLTKRVAEVGFNTIVFDIKPIGGYTVYPSKFSEQLTEWRGERVEPGFDPLHHMVEEGHKQGLSVFVSLNALSEGHSFSRRDYGKPGNQFFKPGWGYDHPELQTVRYVPSPTFDGETVFPSLNPASWDTPLAAFTKVPTAEGIVAYALYDQAGNLKGVTGTRPTEFPGGLVVAAKEAGRSAVTNAPLRLKFGSKAGFSRMAEAQNQIPLMMNPHDERMRARALAFAEEVSKNYAIDGLLYDDRLRFGGLDTDFSDSTKAAFEKFVGRTLVWPSDVFEFVFTNRLETGVRPGPYYDSWLAFRAQALSDWVNQARAVVKRNRPSAAFGIYAGSWYGDYQKYGNNYASTEVAAGFPFLTRAYRSAGMAGSLDVLVTGCYYPTATVFESAVSAQPAGRTVEVGAILSNRIARDQSWVYAGIQLSNFWDDPMRVEPALQAATAASQGVMVFDLSHRIDEFWPVFQRAFSRKARAPHQVPGLLEQVRRTRRDFDSKGFKDPPFPIFEGAPGTGF